MQTSKTLIWMTYGCTNCYNMQLFSWKDSNHISGENHISRSLAFPVKFPVKGSKSYNKKLYHPSMFATLPMLANTWDMLKFYSEDDLNFDEFCSTTTTMINRKLFLQDLQLKVCLRCSIVRAQSLITQENEQFFD